MVDDSGVSLRILDNSFGSRRLFQFANPDKHELYGIEKDTSLQPRCKMLFATRAFNPNS
jgi:hypothetical protein